MSPLICARTVRVECGPLIGDIETAIANLRKLGVPHKARLRFDAFGNAGYGYVTAEWTEKAPE